MLWFLFFIPAFIAIAWGLMILFKRGESLIAQRLLAGALLTGGVVIVCYSQGLRPGQENVHWDDIAFYVVVMAVIPLYYLAIRRLTTLRGIQLRDFFIFAAPAVITVFGTVSLYVFDYEHGYLFSRVFIGFYSAAVLLWSYTAIRSYHRLLSEYCSTVENTSVRSLKQLTIAGIAVIPMALILIAASHNPKWVLLTALIIVLLSALIFAAGYVIYGLRFTAANLQRRLAEYDELERKSSPSPMSAEGAYERCLESLSTAIAGKVFLDPDLTLVMLAEKINTNRTYLSNAIHLTYGKTFSDFVNHLRIQYALSQMRTMHEKKEEILAKDLAELCGYSNNTSFYRAFVRETGLTPKKWMTDYLK
ncbi:MAG: helix-turn-helix domain-containing protein [Bacteroidales bacterium]|nr:helix-turn-helix domain-containing protein [Bacteroidales bacterium]